MKGNNWTPAMEGRFRALHADGKLSFDEMAKQLNEEFGTTLTRNAAIGKAHRLNLALRLTPQVKRAFITKDVKVMKKKPSSRPLPAVLRDQVPFTLTITELEYGDCKWPSGGPYDWPPFFYCGRPAIEGCPYCKPHMERAHGPAYRSAA